jgi:hypothetical protein
MTAVTSGALDGLKERHHSFFERLNALLDLCGVVEPGAGRQTWIAHQGQVTSLAVKGWEQGRRVRNGNVETLAAAIVADLPVKCSQEEISNYLRGDRPDIDVSLELRRLGLSMPNQAWFLNLLNEEMAEQGMNPTDPKLFGIWSTTAIKVAQYYAAALSDEDKETPDEPRLKRVMGHYIGLYLEGAVEPGSR